MNCDTQNALSKITYEGNNNELIQLSKNFDLIKKSELTTEANELKNQILTYDKCVEILILAEKFGNEDLFNICKQYCAQVVIKLIDQDFDRWKEVNDHVARKVLEIKFSGR